MGYEIQYAGRGSVWIYSTVVDMTVSPSLSPSGVEKWFVANIMRDSQKWSYYMRGNKPSGMKFKGTPASPGEREVSADVYAKAIGRIWKKEARSVIKKNEAYRHG